MAIQKDLPETSIGVGFKASYIRITIASYQKIPPPGAWENPPSEHVQLSVAGYVYKPTSLNQTPIWAHLFLIPWDEVKSQPGDNFLAQCYAWLHTQEEFKDAEVV